MSQESTITSMTPMDGVDDGKTELRRVGRQLSMGLIALLRMIRVHDGANEATTATVNKLLDVYDRAAAIQAELSVRMYANEFYVGEARLRIPRSSFEMFEEFKADLIAREVGAIGFECRPREDELLAFAVAWRDVISEDIDNPYKELARALRSKRVGSIRIERYVDTTLLDLPVIEGIGLVRQTYFRTVDVAFRSYEEARSGRPVTIKHLKRASQRLVDVLYADDAREADLLVLLTDIKRWRDYESNHAANTAILSLGIGMAIGLPRRELRDLGLAALLADIGHAMIDDETLHSTEKLTEEQCREIENHPLAAVPLLAGHEQMDDALMKAAVACVQHHRGFDGGGYPRTVKDKPTLYAQIIAIADRFDAMTTPRPYRPVGMTTARALERICEAAGRDLNPALVEVFVRFLDRLPPANVVMLESGDIGVVMRQRSRLHGRTQPLLGLIAEPTNDPLQRLAL